MTRVPQAEALIAALRAGGLLDRLVLLREVTKVQAWEGTSLDSLDLASVGGAPHRGWESADWAGALRRATAPGRWRRPVADGLLVVVITEEGPPPAKDDLLSSPAGRWATLLELGRDIGGPLHLAAFQALRTPRSTPAEGLTEMLEHLVLLGRQATHWNQLVHTWLAGQAADSAETAAEVAAIVAIARTPESAGGAGTMALRHVTL
jgi:hypothetical protein